MLVTPRSWHAAGNRAGGSARAARLALTAQPLVDSAAVAGRLLTDYRTAFAELGYLT